MRRFLSKNEYLLINFKKCLPFVERLLTKTWLFCTLDLVSQREFSRKHSGHTAGLLGLMMHLKNTGIVIYTSDAINCTDNYNFKYPGICYDSLGFVQCVKYVHRLEKQYNATIWFSHDAKQFHTLTLSDQGYYD